MDIIVKRNTRQTLTFRKPGDYSGDTVVFTMKKDKSLTSKREVDLVATVTYSASTLISTFEVDLFPSTSASLVNDVYPFDLRVENSSTDREPLESGNAYIDKSVRNDTDGSAVATTSNVTVLTGADFNAGDSLVSDGTDIVGETASERKTALGIDPHYRVVQYLTGNGSTISNFNEPTFINGIPNSTIDTDWTRVGAGTYKKSISSTGTAFTGSSFSSRKFIGNGVIFDMNVAEAAIGLYRAQIIWTGSIWQIELYTANLSGVITDLYFATDPLTINIGLNPA